MRHRNYLTGLPVALVGRLAADIVGTKRGAALTQRLETLADEARFQLSLYADVLLRLAFDAAGVAFGVAVLGLAIAVEVMRKGA